MATKQDWLLYIKERKGFSKVYEKETIKLEKKVAKLPDGDVGAFDAGPGSNPTPPPPPPPGTNP